MTDPKIAALSRVLSRFGRTSTDAGQVPTVILDPLDRERDDCSSDGSPDCYVERKLTEIRGALAASNISASVRHCEKGFFSVELEVPRDR